MCKNINILKRTFVFTLAVILLLGMTGCAGLLPSNDATTMEEVQEFYDLVRESQGLLDAVADTIYDNWHGAIYDDEFYGSIDVAIYAAQVEHEEDLARIEELDALIIESFKSAKTAECDDQVKAVMSAYSEYYEFVVNVSGSFNSFSASKETLKKELASTLKELSFEL